MKKHVLQPTSSKLMLAALTLTLCISTSCKRNASDQVDQPNIEIGAKTDASISAFTPNGVSVASATAYSTASGSTTIGSIGVNENVKIITTSGSRTQITYFTSGADKTGWVASSSVVATGWQWPVKAVNKTQDFHSYSSSRGGYHLAIDLTSVLGDTNILAPFGGVVKTKGYGSGNGNHVIIEHNKPGGGKIYSLYCHMSSFASSYSVGSTISKGTVLGVMGCTGSCSGTHLHFAIYNNNYSSNPYGYTSSGGTLISHSSSKIVMDYATHYDPEYVIRNNGNTP